MISVQISIIRHLFKVKLGYNVFTDGIITSDVNTVYNTHINSLAIKVTQHALRSINVGQ